MQEKIARAKRTLWVVIFLLILCALALYTSFSGGLPDVDTVPASPLSLTPADKTALGAVAVITASILFFLNSRYGPLFMFMFGGRAQRSPWRNMTLLFVGAAVLVVVYESFLRSTSTLVFPRWFDLLILLGAGGVLVISIVNLPLMYYRVLSLKENMPIEQYEEITSQNESLPPQVSSLVDELNSLGFSELAHCRLLLPGRQEPSQCLILANQEHKVIAGTAWSRSLADLGTVFASFFSDNALLETYYPPRANAKYPYFQASGTNESLSRAWEQHNRCLETFSNQHEHPVSIDSLHSYLEGSKRTWHLRWQVYKGQMLSLAAVWITLALALISVILVLQSAGNGSAGIATLCILPIVYVMLLGGIAWIGGMVKTLQKMR
jgi:hypothetical protein